MANKQTKIKKTAVSDENQLGSFIKLIIIVAVLFLAFYLLTILINKKKEVADVPATIQYDTILAGNILSQPKDAYFVLINNSDDQANGLYKTYIDLYTQKNTESRVYYVDLDNPFNNKFVGEDSNLNINDISELKLKDITLIKVEAGKIASSYEGKDNVKTILKQMAGVAE